MLQFHVQANSFDTKALRGYWVAEEFMRSFDRTKSISVSVSAFDPVVMVAMRINPNEVNNDMAHIGFGYLHSHLIYDEVPHYMVQGKDTIYEAGNYSISLNKTDSVGWFGVENGDEIDDPLFKPVYGKDTLILVKRGVGMFDRVYVYRRIDRGFAPGCEHSNPLYYYTRKTILAGSYILKDSKGKVLSSDFSIGLDGFSKGFSLFDGLRFYYSTDIFCGGPLSREVDRIVICASLTDENDQKYYVYRVNKKSNGDLVFSNVVRRIYDKRRLTKARDKLRAVYMLEKKTNR